MPEAATTIEGGKIFWRPVGDALKAIDEADRGRPRQSFLILGAGMAGLAAAYELGSRGHTVTVLEAANERQADGTAGRVGGRVWTWRSPDGRFYGERAAMRIPDAHDYTYHYVDEVGLTGDLRPFCNSVGTGFLSIGGMVVQESEYQEKVFPLFRGGMTEAERRAAAAAPGGLLTYLMAPLFRWLLERPERARALLAGDFRDPDLARLDTVSWRGYLAGLTPKPSDAAMELLRRVLGLGAIWDWSLAAILRNELGHLEPSFVEIAGGLDRLPWGLYRRLPSTVQVQFGQEVLDLAAGASGGGSVRVRDRETGRQREVRFSRLLVTLPFPVLAGMKLPGLSPEKQLAIQRLRLASACKDLLAYERRFWEEEGIRGGSSATDGPEKDVLYFRQAYYPMDSLPPGGCPEPASLRVAVPGTEGLPGLFSLYARATSVPEAVRAAPPGDPTKPGTLLAAYTLDKGAQALQGMTAEERRKAVLDGLRSLHGDAVDGFVHHEAWSWDEYPWSRGGVAITPPGYLVRHWAAAKRPERGIHFAGDHLSIAPAWIQGALESSLREVEGMLRSRD